jgi:hypothetical protein
MLISNQSNPNPNPPDDPGLSGPRSTPHLLMLALGPIFLVLLSLILSGKVLRREIRSQAPPQQETQEIIRAPPSRRNPKLTMNVFKMFRFERSTRRMELQL